ncbi:MAG: lamin tail domain-containing protein [Candidatus Pacebacteria bacterium]|nr:lamin tail domain-containing protein [Candidatus Paceibacterota bacterium]
MIKKLFLFVVCSIFLLSFRIASADVVINEIMYNPTGGDTNVEWIELYNNGISSVDLSSWFITDYDSSWHFHTISPENTATISAGGYAVLVHTSQSAFDVFKEKMPAYSGLLFRASFTLGNVSGRIGLSSDHSTIIGDTSYVGTIETDDTDKSLQFVSGEWVASIQTPGANNQPLPVASDSTSSPSGSGGGTSSSSVNTKIDPNPKVTEVPKIKVEVIHKPIAFVDIPLVFQSKALGYSGEVLSYGKYYWNFGDGDFRETKVLGQEKFTHTYYYPGVYTVLLEYYTNYYSDVPDASIETTIKVVSQDIAISKIGDEKDFFVEISNSTGYDSDISGWMLIGQSTTYIFPKNTIIDAKGKIIVPGRTTKLSLADKNYLKLMNSEGEEIYNFNLITEPAVVRISSKPKSITTNLTKDIDESMSMNQNNVAIDTMPILVESNSAQAGAGSSSSLLIYGALIGILALAVISTYFIRQKKSQEVLGEDFDILDE